MYSVGDWNFKLFLLHKKLRLNWGWVEVELRICPCLIFRGLQGDVVFRGWPKAPSYYEPKCWGRGGEVAGSQPMSTEYTRAQINFRDLTPNLTYSHIVQILKRLAWPELFSLSLLCVSLLMANEWGGSFFWPIALSHDTQKRMRLNREARPQEQPQVTQDLRLNRRTHRMIKNYAIGVYLRKTEGIKFYILRISVGFKRRLRITVREK